MSDPQLAELALGRLMELSPEMRGGAIIDREKVLAASGDAAEWGEAAGALLALSDEDGGAAEQVHVATESGEVFAVRDAGLLAVAVTERFVLASLMAFDMRSVLRDLAAGGAPADHAADGGGA